MTQIVPFYENLGMTRVPSGPPDMCHEVGRRKQGLRP